MQSAEFNEIIEAKILEIQNTLVKKGGEYAPGADTDRLANFRKAAHLQGTNMKQALQGMLAKHTVSIADMIASGDDYPQAVWDEKIGDSLVYHLLLCAVIWEEKNEAADEYEAERDLEFKTFYSAMELNRYAAEHNYVLREVKREDAKEGDLLLWLESKGSFFAYRPEGINAPSDWTQKDIDNNAVALPPFGGATPNAMLSRKFMAPIPVFVEKIPNNEREVFATHADGYRTRVPRWQLAGDLAVDTPQPEPLAEWELALLNGGADPEPGWKGRVYKTAGGFISYPDYDTVQRHGINLPRDWMTHPDPNDAGPDDLLVRENDTYYKRIR